MNFHVFVISFLCLVLVGELFLAITTNNKVTNRIAIFSAMIIVAILFINVNHHEIATQALTDKKSAIGVEITAESTTPTMVYDSTADASAWRLESEATAYAGTIWKLMEGKEVSLRELRPFIQKDGDGVMWLTSQKTGIPKKDIFDMIYGDRIVVRYIPYAEQKPSPNAGK